MIAVDTSSLVAYLEGSHGPDVDAVHAALEAHQLVLPPVVLTETLSDPGIPEVVRRLLTELPMLEIEPGYWERAGSLRASLLKQKRKARVADALIAQACLDQGVALVTRDKDFRNFAAAAGLALF